MLTKQSFKHLLDKTKSYYSHSQRSELWVTNGPTNYEVCETNSIALNKEYRASYYTKLLLNALECIHEELMQNVTDYFNNRDAIVNTIHEECLREHELDICRYCNQPDKQRRLSQYAKINSMLTEHSEESDVNEPLTNTTEETK